LVLLIIIRYVNYPSIHNYDKVHSCDIKTA